MHAQQIFETVLYATDLEAAEQFYRDVMGLTLQSSAPLMRIFRCGPGVLLIFDPAQSSVPGRDVPSHGATGAGHIVFACPAAELDAWRAHFAARGVEIEREVEWDVGGLSLYVRDPAGNSVELAPPTLWGGGWAF
jgi:catechol 2,3-dioxygenase-like lactoylglutathione lyase family enzyme